MKKFIAISAMLVSLVAFSARAGVPAEKIQNTVQKETAIRNSLWYGSSSSAGLAFRPYNIFNTLDLTYDGGFGEYRKNGVGKKSSDISLNTSGAAYIGKFLATGGFSFKNVFERDALYNVLMYELDDNMPYYPIDDKSSGWNKQKYLLNAGLSSPVLWNRVSFGLKVDYTTKVGAKQLDPRGETYKYAVEVTPSVAVRFGETLLGISGTYMDGFERCTVSNNNNWENPKVWEHRGLGESTQNKVGGNDGMKNHTYRTRRYGGAFQYSFGKNIFVEVGFEHRVTDGNENPSLPRKLGSVKENDINLNASWLFGEDSSDKLYLNAKYSSIDGIEYVQKLSTVAYQQKWMVISTNEMSTYTGISAKLGYDHLFGASDRRGYNWKVGAEVSYDSFDQSYVSPESASNAMRAYAGLIADKHFKMQKSSLLLGLNAGYAAGFGEGYTCLSAKAYDAPKSMLKDQADWLNASFVRAGAHIDWTISEGRKVSWIAAAKAEYISAMSISKDRVLCSASFGILF